jgi:hypothetical protein
MKRWDYRYRVRDRYAMKVGGTRTRVVCIPARRQDAGQEWVCAVHADRSIIMPPTSPLREDTGKP